MARVPVSRSVGVFGLYPIHVHAHYTVLLNALVSPISTGETALIAEKRTTFEAVPSVCVRSGVLS